MKLIIFNMKNIFFFIIFNMLILINNQQLQLNQSYYYEEKYFRILTNNYEDIVQGEFWQIDNENGGFGFIAKKDFGSLILLKDWSMYNFKLTKVIFRNECSFIYGDRKCDAEMWLIHTKDSSYYPPGRRIYIKQNYFIIVVPFEKTDNKNPGVDSIFDSLNLEAYKVTEGEKKDKITPEKPVKLYKIIQNQPSLLFDGTYKERQTLIMVFTQYHFISEANFEELNALYTKEQITIKGYIKFDDNEGNDQVKIFRNVKNDEEIKPKVTLLSYNKANFLNSILPLLIIFLF